MTPNQFMEIRNRLQTQHEKLKDNQYYSPWKTIKDVARLMGWTEPKARYWLERMVDKRWVCWRWSSQGRGWYQYKVYRLAWLHPKGKTP